MPWTMIVVSASMRMAHRFAPIFSTARRAASCMDTERSAYSTPYFSRILKPSSSRRPGMRKIAIFSAGS
jgi:hypothetical protein